MKPAGIILAAGESSRMGRDKALLPYRGSTFLHHILKGFLPRLHPVIVVLGHRAALIRESIAAGALPRQDRNRVRVVVNCDYRRGMLSSLQTAIAALPGSLEAVLFTLVDHPDVRPQTLDALLSAYLETRAPLVVPQKGDRRGHPIVASRAVLNEIARLPAEASLQDVVRSLRAETVFVEVDDPGILRDVDTPSEYKRLLLAETGTDPSQK